MEISLEGTAPDAGLMPTLINMSVTHGLADVKPSSNISLPVFPYAPLNKNRREIRLVALKSGSSFEPLECSIRTMAINEAWRLKWKAYSYRYKALSYAWGPEEPTKTMYLQGIQIRVRENLWQALHHLRSPDQELCIWIDAICINQEDIPERNHQVSIMPYIYSHAAEVIVWLGPERDSSKLAMETLQNYVGLGGQRLSDAERHAIAGLLDREYWKRTWIIQEVLKASIIMIHCGYQNLNWDLLTEFLSENFRQCNAAMLAMDASLQGEARAHSLGELLEKYQSALSSDPRDKVYSLVSLAGGRLCGKWDRPLETDWAAAIDYSESSFDLTCISIDYSKSAFDLFCTLALMFYKKERGAVRRMQLLYKILSLQQLILDRELAKPASRVLASNKVSDRGYVYMSSIEFFGPFWYGNACQQGGNGTKEKIMEWYRSLSEDPGASTLAESKSEKINSLEKSLEVFEDKHMKYFEPDPQKWQGTSVRVFMDENGWAGFVPNDTKADDRLVCFYASNIVLVVRGGEKVVIGRAVMLQPNFRNYLTTMPYFSMRELNHTITMSLEDWCHVF